jgi:CHAD domain-containing protein
VVREHLEVERKYDVDGSYSPPSAADLAALPGVVTVDDPVEHLLEAGYFDTADLRLFRGRVTLRRRTGGPDAGWHVKLPAADGARRELHAPLGRAVRRPPAPLVAPVAGLLRGAAVGPVATLRTRRVVTALRDGGGRVLAELADDTVTATVPGAGEGEVLAWREVEVELVDGDESLLDAAAEVLASAGARPSATSSKLGRALASRLADGGRATGKQRKGGPRAGDVVMEAVRTQVGALQAADLMLRTGQPNAVHRIRVAARRLRSILADFGSVLGRDATRPLRAELAWLGGELSTARDDEVALAHLRAVVAAEPVELVLGPVAARLQQTELRANLAGVSAAEETLADARYLRLLDALHVLLEAPPSGERAGGAARPVLRRAVRRATERLDRRMAHVRRVDGDQRDDDLHDVRKAAKRLRYTAEVAADEFGGPVRTAVRAAKQVQRALGERQDTVVTREHCRRLAIAATAAGESAFAYGRLHALEQARAERAGARFEALEPTLPPLLRAARKKG